MPKQKPKPQNPNDEPAVRAAFVTRKGTIITAAITALATIVVAVIGLADKWNEKSPPSVQKEKLVVKVVDKTSGSPVGNAKVSLEASGVFAVNSTDSDGVISFPIADTKKELRLRVEADGYEQNFNLRVTPSDIVCAQEIRLTPLATPTPTATRTNPITTVTLNPAITNVSSLIRGQVIDETGAVLPGVRITVAGFGKSVITNESGNFEISIPVAKGRSIDLHVAKDGFRTRTQEHIVNNDSVRIIS